MKKRIACLIASILTFTALTNSAFAKSEVQAKNSKLTKIEAKIETKDENVLSKHIIPIKTTKSDETFTDLMPLKEILKDKKIIAMGEATHGTKEFSEMKHRMFEFLVKEMGYKGFAIEMDLGNVEVINDYILYGKGNLDSSLSYGLYSIWQTKEVADMITWMKKYNDGVQPKDKIHVYGFDMQSTYDDVELLLNYLKLNDKVSYDKIYKTLEEIKEDDINEDVKGYEIKHEINEVKSIINTLKKDFEDKKDSYIKSSSKEEYTYRLQNLESILYKIRLKEIWWKSYSKIRDEHMAKQFDWIVEQEAKRGNDKIMIWAHNAHISTGNLSNVKWMGSWLRQTYKDELYTIALDFYKGSYRAYDSERVFKSYTVKEDKNSYGVDIVNANKNVSFLDFNSMKKDDKAKAWFDNKKSMYAIGHSYSVFTPRDFCKIDTSYDALIFIENANSAESYFIDKK